MKSSVILFAAPCVFPSITDAFQVPSQLTIRASPLTLLDAAPRDTSDHTRRSFLIASTAFVASLSTSNPALAKYGEGSNLELPSYIDYLIEKNSANEAKVEAKVLYKGTDPSVLLRRLKEAEKRLGDIPALAEQKKWSQIQGVLTGPLGTFSQTLNQIATRDSSPKVQDASKKLKSAIIEIGQAASRKNGDACTAKVQQASQDLEVFVKAAFE
jgi:hypothetical protein